MQDNNINFTQVLQQRNELFLFFADNDSSLTENFEIFSKLPAWTDLYHKVTVILPEFQSSFYRTITKDFARFNVISYNNLPNIISNASIINFNKKEHSEKKISFDNCVIIGVNNSVNLRLHPVPENNIELLSRAAEILDVTIVDSAIELTILPPKECKVFLDLNQVLNRKLFSENITGNYLISATGNTGGLLSSLLRIFKQDSEVNMSLDLLDCISYSIGSSLTVTDNEDFYRLLKKADCLGNIVYLDKSIDKKELLIKVSSYLAETEEEL